eukprot:s61_g23.t1
MKTEFISSGHILGAIRSHSLGSGLAFHSPVTMDQQAQMLSEICGADVDSCSAALYQCEGDADQAATLLIEAAQLLQPNSPVRQTEVSPLSQLLEMGYGRQLAEYALQTCNGDLQIAAEFLQDSSPASAPAPARQDDMRTIGVCAICTEPLTPSDAAMRCAGPGGHHYGHAACLAQWVEACQSRNQEPTCPECRGPLQLRRRQIQEFLDEPPGCGALEDGKTNGRSEWGDAESEVEGREALGQERTILVLEIAKVPEGLVAGNLKDFESIVFVVADFQVIGVERNLPLLFNPLHNTRKHTVKRVGLGPDGGAAAEPGPGAGDGALVERLLSSESEVTVGSTGGWDGGDSGTGRIGVGVGPASDVGGADGVDSTGSETEAVGLGGGGISVDGRADTGVDAIRRRLTRRSGAGGGE